MAMAEEEQERRRAALEEMRALTPEQWARRNVEKETALRDSFFNREEHAKKDAALKEFFWDEEAEWRKTEFEGMDMKDLRNNLDDWTRRKAEKDGKSFIERFYLELAQGRRDAENEERREDEDQKMKEDKDTQTVREIKGTKREERREEGQRRKKEKMPKEMEREERKRAVLEIEEREWRDYLSETKESGKDGIKTVETGVHTKERERKMRGAEWLKRKERREAQYGESSGAQDWERREAQEWERAIREVENEEREREERRRVEEARERGRQARGEGMTCPYKLHSSLSRRSMILGGGVKYPLRCLQANIFPM